ncbi:hypothetical protein [Acinetobacter nosocomialis]|uniref:hypothetical protein n=1 Tax=Acinetobacter nosocomialis TaxID=106654 RepID=UPI003F6470DE
MSFAEISYVFDELISRNLQINNLESEDLIAYLEKIRRKELFIIDILRSKGVMAQKSKIQESIEFNQYENIHIPIFKFRPSLFAKKWFPYQPIFEPFYLRKEDGLNRFELSQQTILLLRIIKKYMRDSKVYSEKDKASISEILLLESIDNKINRLELEQVALGELQLIEKVLKEFIDEAEKPSIKKYSQYEKARFNKKNREYKSYVQELMTVFGEMYAISINFWWEGKTDTIDGQKSNLKKKFFNNLRSHYDFDVIKGHIGVWEYSHERGLYFRCIFFCVKSKHHSIDYTIESLIGYWEQGFANKSEGRVAGEIIYSAELAPLAYTKSASLNQPIILLNNKNRKLLENFYNIVLNYVTISEKYYYPIELQVELLVLSSFLDQDKSDDNGFNLKKYGPSRSFRGHLRKSNAKN